MAQESRLPESRAITGLWLKELQLLRPAVRRPPKGARDLVGGSVRQLPRLQLVQPAAIHASHVLEVLHGDVVERLPDPPRECRLLPKLVSQLCPRVEHEVHVRRGGAGIIADEAKRPPARVSASHVRAHDGRSRTLLLGVPTGAVGTQIALTYALVDTPLQVSPEGRVPGLHRILREGTV